MSESEFAEDLTIYPDLNRMTFAMDPRYIDWDLIDERDDSFPSSKSNRRLMREMGISGRTVRRRPRRWKEDDWD